MVTPVAFSVLVTIFISKFGKSYQLIILIIIFIFNSFIFFQFLQPKRYISVSYFNWQYQDWKNYYKTQEFAYFEPGYNLKESKEGFKDTPIKSFANKGTLLSLVITALIFSYQPLSKLLFFLVKLYRGVVKMAKQYSWKCPVDGEIFNSPEEQDEHMQKTGHLIYDNLEDKGKVTKKEPDDLSFSRHSGYTPGISSGDVMDNKADLESKKRVEEKKK